MILLNKFSLKLIIYLFLLLVSFTSLYYLENFKYLFLSKLDSNYWLNSIKLNKEGNLDADIHNLLKVSKKNKKYRDKATLNYFYYYNELNDTNKNKIIDEL